MQTPRYRLGRAPRPRVALSWSAMRCSIVLCLAVAGAADFAHAAASPARGLTPQTTAAAAPHSDVASTAVDHRRIRRHRTSTNLPAVLQPSPTHHLTLLKIGDSLGEELGFGLRDAIGANPNVTLIQDAVGDTGLARPDYYNWPVHLASELAQYHPRAVIVMLGGDDGQGFVDQGRTVYFGSSLWHTIYTERVNTMMNEALAAGSHVIWVGLPIMGPGVLAQEMAQMNSIYAAEAGLHPGVTFVPTWSLFASSSGRYSAYLPGPNGQMVLMRNPDGVHFSGAGADRLANAVVNSMDGAWKIHL